MTGRDFDNTDMHRVYVWELPIRLTHWVLFATIIVLSATGYYIGHPFIGVAGAAGDHFVMGMARAVHMYAAGVFVAAALVRFYWMFAGNKYARLTELVPLSGRRLRSFFNAVFYYAFIRREPDSYPGHNAMAGSSYVMIYTVYIVMTVTGLILYAVGAAPGSPFRVFDSLAPLLFGLQMTRLIHHIGMWVIAVFVIMHLHFVLLSSLIERTGAYDSIFSGFKFVPGKPEASRD